MNLSNAFLALVLVVAAIYSEAGEVLEGVEFGELKTAGNACFNLDSNLTTEQGELEPMNLRAKKAADQILLRGQCGFSLPVQLIPGFKLKVTKLEVAGIANLRKGSRGQLNLEIFKATQKGVIHQLNFDASEKRIREDFELSKDQELLTIGCGEAGLIRGQAAILLQGQNRATLSVDKLKLKFEIEKCHDN